MSSTLSVPFCVPFTGDHVSIMNGGSGRCIKTLAVKFGVTISVIDRDPALPYFLIQQVAEGDELSVLFAALKVHALLSVNNEKGFGWRYKNGCCSCAIHRKLGRVDESIKDWRTKLNKMYYDWRQLDIKNRTIRELISLQLIYDDLGLCDWWKVAKEDGGCLKSEGCNNTFPFYRMS